MKLMLANFAKMINATGGLAKVTCAFANEMIARGHEVSLIYCDEKQGRFFYPIDKKVKVINLYHYGNQNYQFPLRMKLKREILRPLNIRKSRDVNDQFMIRYLQDSLRCVLADILPEVIVASQPAATRMLKNVIQVDVPVITMSHGDPEDYFHTYPKEEVIALAKSCVCQVLLPSYEKAIKSRIPDMPVEIIGNVVPQYSVQVDLSKIKNKYKILFVGRLNKNHKCPHLLIETFCKIANDFPEWCVELWGDIDNKTYFQYMRSIIKKYKLEDKIKFMGVTENIQMVLETGDIFVMPSAYEGFPLSLTEAMSIGMPVVAYKACSGANELIKDNVNGILCDEGVSGLEKGLRKLMEARELRENLGNNAHKDMLYYNAHEIWNKWEDLIMRVYNSIGEKNE
ncbi:MAG: glycosyltransferase [Selenomonas sp.]|uniref:glycosyltransferase n=1 Tax=Selenomonas sp. TaxID=2053611 RepID=UPI0025D847AC|nr:glycosyltransferase [Selenomonas sp.]MCR5757022.1 glycosyltransferase [Selenomonas sp.]